MQTSKQEQFFFFGGGGGIARSKNVQMAFTPELDNVHEHEQELVHIY
jgi:hypothetical protein